MILSFIQFIIYNIIKCILSELCLCRIYILIVETDHEQYIQITTYDEFNKGREQGAAVREKNGQDFRLVREGLS